MKIRIYDRFDSHFTCATYDNVDRIIDRDIYFTDGEVLEGYFDPEFEDWEEIK